jgi:hypothetical protein
MENGDSGAGFKGRWNDIETAGEQILGQNCARIMAWVRLIIDETLKTEYALFVTKEERKILQSESKMLKKYSDQTTIQKLTGRPVKPTVEQRNEFRLRQLELRGPPKSEKHVSDRAQEQAAEQSEEPLGSKLTEAAVQSEDQVGQPQERTTGQAEEQVASQPTEEVAAQTQEQEEPTLPREETKS